MGGFGFIFSILAYLLSSSLVSVTLSLIYVASLLSIYRFGLVNRLVGWLI
jgi:hypothetical protein